MTGGFGTGLATGWSFLSWFVAFLVLCNVLFFFAAITSRKRRQRRRRERQ